MSLIEREYMSEQYRKEKYKLKRKNIEQKNELWKLYGNEKNDFLIESR